MKRIIAFILSVSLVIVMCASCAFNEEAKGTYVGSVNSDIYHEPDCEWAEKITENNEIWFDDASDAHNQGYRGCYVCNP